MESMVLNAPSAIGASAVMAMIYLLFSFFLRPKSPLAKFPSLGKASDRHLQHFLIQGSKIYPDSPYTIPEVPHSSNTLILPKKYIDEVKSLPETSLGFMQGIYHRFGGKYTTLGDLGAENHVMVESVKIDLTRNIARTLKGLQDEADFAIPSCIGSCDDWTPVRFFPKVLRVIALLSGRIFVGQPLCRNEEWISATINYTIDTFAAVPPVWKIPPLLRPFIAPWLPEVRRIQQNRKRGARLLKPILEKRFEDMKNPDFKPPADMIQFSIQHSGAKGEDALFQSFVQMVVSLAAIHTTAMTITHVVYNLATYPQYQEPLREELEKVLALDKGILSKSSMTKLRKLDSFIRESQRMTPPNAISLTRFTLQDITLSDGLFIPAGTYTGFSSIGINRDPAVYPSPDTFDGFRFSKLRSQPGNENRYQFVTTGEDAIAFGHGKHACPGRFFASNEIKVILVGLLLRYDIRLKEGEGRPEDILSRTQINPNRGAEIMFRKRGNV